MTLKIGVAQLNPALGDVQANAQAIIAAAEQAHGQGLQVLLTPELSLCSPAAFDLWRRPSFLAACDAALEQLVEASQAWPSLKIVVGHPERAPDGGLYLAASVLGQGRVWRVARRQHLVQRGPVDEASYFVPFPVGIESEPACFEVDGWRVGLLLGLDMLQGQGAERLRAAGADVLLVPAASAYRVGRREQLRVQLATRARACGLPLVVAQPVGGLDELVYCGGSAALGADGLVRGRASLFEQQLWPVQLSRQAGGAVRVHAELADPLDADGALWRALVLGLRDYVEKNGFPSVALGLSGGMDSALALVLAVDALGPERVHAFMLPGPYTADISLHDARELAGRLGVPYQSIPIAAAFDALHASLLPLFDGKPADTTEENMQARIRGLMLMALSNKHGHLVLACGNKSEYAVGYSTLYGDMCGGFAPIRDVFKTAVYRLAHWRNANDPWARGAVPIPERIITRAPSAELRPDQRDDDSLPPYEVLDVLLAAHLEEDLGRDELVARGFEAALVERVLSLVRRGEYKRRQAALGTRVTLRGFGADWRYPVSHQFRF